MVSGNSFLSNKLKICSKNRMSLSETSTKSQFWTRSSFTLADISKLGFKSPWKSRKHKIWRVSLNFVSSKKMADLTWSQLDIYDPQLSIRHRWTANDKIQNKTKFRILEISWKTFAKIVLNMALRLARVKKELQFLEKVTFVKNYPKIIKNFNIMTVF